MTKAMIVYASLTGNTKACSDMIEDKLKEHGIEVDVLNSVDAIPDVFLNVDICIVGTYTYGEDGDLPDEIVDFYEDLAKLNLKERVFGVFGSGDTYYDKFCPSVDDFEEQFLETGAIKGAESVKIDLKPDNQELKLFEVFVKSIVWKQRQLI